MRLVYINFGISLLAAGALYLVTEWKGQASEVRSRSSGTAKNQIDTQAQVNSDSAYHSNLLFKVLAFFYPIEPPPSDAVPSCTPEYKPAAIAKLCQEGATKDPMVP